MCFGCTKEPSHRDGSFEYPQYMFLLRNKKDNFQISALILGPDTSLHSIDYLINKMIKYHKNQIIVYWQVIIYTHYLLIDLYLIY